MTLLTPSQVVVDPILRYLNELTHLRMALLILYENLLSC